MSMSKLEMYIPKWPYGPLATLTDNLADKFGGVTSLYSSGVWRSPSGNMIREDGVVLVSFFEDTLDNLLYIEELARQYKARAQQECVLFSVDGKPTFLEE